jgi:hypothetical protein
MTYIYPARIALSCCDAPMTADYAQAVGGQQAWSAIENSDIGGFAILIPQPCYVLLDNVR